MSSTTKTAVKPRTEDAVKNALNDFSGATAERVAGAVGIGLSTARKVLARLAEAGEVTREEGGREAGRRLPDRYSLCSTQVSESNATPAITESSASPKGTAGEGSELKAAEPKGTTESGAQAKAGDSKGSEPQAQAGVHDRDLGASREGRARKAADRPSVEPREGSTMWAAIKVLRDKGEPMRAAEIYAEIREHNLAPGLKGKTPEQTVAAQLAVHAKRGLYVERPERGKFQLRSEAMAG
jgi:hypothetical protein